MIALKLGTSEGTLEYISYMEFRLGVWLGGGGLAWLEGIRP